MNDKDLYRKILGIHTPWGVQKVELDKEEGEIRIHVEHGGRRRLTCPTCGKACPGYDSRQRRWRHLDTCQYRTILVADMPRVECGEHGVLQVRAPWAEAGSRFTALFEALVLDWLHEASIQAVARQLNLSWSAVDGIMQRGVDRGEARRERRAPTRLLVDETSFRKRHDYVTVVSDGVTRVVLHVAVDRRQSSLQDYLETLSEDERSNLESISMDMWQAYITAAREALPDADDKICFDKFHVAKHLGEAVDKVRRQEHKTLRQEGDTRLLGTKYHWLTNPRNMSGKRRRDFRALRDSNLKTARAWAIKETAMSLWDYDSMGWAKRAWTKWLSWAVRSRLDPILKTAKMIRKHLPGILNAIVLKVTNAGAESINSRIKMIKVRCRGFRNKTRFQRAILFYLGGLNVYPDTSKP